MIANINTVELTRLWSELRDAEDGIHRYGGDTAEFYAYRFGTPSPFLDGLPRSSKNTRLIEYGRGKARALYELLRLYATEREVQIEVNGMLIGEWLCMEEFLHRAHVRVIKEKTKAEKL